MRYKFEILPAAQKQFLKLNPTVAQRILKKLSWLEKQANPLTYAVKLKPPAIGDIRFRFGDYRVIALVDSKQKVISVAAVGHRREVYRS